MRYGENRVSMSSLFGFRVDLISVPPKRIRLLKSVIQIGSTGRRITEPATKQLASLLYLPLRYIERVRRRNWSIFASMMHDALETTRQAEICFVCSGNEVLAVWRGNADSVRKTFANVAEGLSIWGSNDRVIRLIGWKDGLQLLASPHESELPSSRILLRIEGDGRIRLNPSLELPLGGRITATDYGKSVDRYSISSSEELCDLLDLLMSYADDLRTLYIERSSTPISDPIVYMLEMGATRGLVHRAFSALRGVDLGTLGPIVDAVAQVAKSSPESELPLKFLENTCE